MATNEEMAATKVMEALLYMAPDDDAKRLILRMRTDAEKENCNTLKTMTCAMADGVLYGNWPWIVARMAKAT